MDITTRAQEMGKQVLSLVLITAMLAAGGIVTSIGPSLDGEAFGYSRIALGILGLIGAGLVLCGARMNQTGHLLIMVWAAIQSIYYADAVGGNFTRQLIDAFAGASSSTTINGEVTTYSAVGINLVGLAMLIFAYACRTQIAAWNRRTSVEMPA